MKITKTRRIYAAIVLVALVCATVIGHSASTFAATKLSIDLKENQTFYILPGNPLPTQHQIKINSDKLGEITCSSSNLTVASVDNFGLMTIQDAGNTKITVSNGSKKITRNITVLVRTDWTKAVEIKNYQKLEIKNDIVSMKMKNLMNYPVRVTFTYNTYSDQGSLLKTGLKSEEVYLAANKTSNYKMMPGEDATYISITGMNFYSDQFGSKTIDPKKVTSKTKTIKKPGDKNVRIATATVTNKNKNHVIVPYHIYLYNEKKEVIGVQYRFLQLAGKQSDTVSYSYVPSDKFLENYAANVKFVFETAMPYF